MKKRIVLIAFGIVIGTLPVRSAYHHMGESDTAKFLEAYPDKAGTKLDNCALCHTGGAYQQDGREVSLGSCQWCHHAYGYDGSGDIAETMNAYGTAFLERGRNADAVRAIEQLDSDGDGFSNRAEIDTDRFPGDPNDDPTKKAAPFKIYTRAQLETFPVHTEFLVMNTNKSGDFYAEYSGVVLENLLRDAGISETATGITVFSPDGWSQYHPIHYDDDPAMYPVFWTYPQAVYFHVHDSDQWCNYASPPCQGRVNGELITVSGGLKLMLAYKREGADLTPGVLDNNNRLNGEGPYRIVVPQKVPNPPDQSSTAPDQTVTWPFNEEWDHNAGVSTRSATVIRVEPLPPGTTDIDPVESGWSYIDLESIVIYGAISPD